MLALWCDIRIAAADAKLTTAFARLGLVAEHGAAWLLPRIVGRAHAADLLLSGRTITGAEAEAIGLVNRAVEGAADAHRGDELCTRTGEHRRASQLADDQAATR